MNHEANDSSWVQTEMGNSAAVAAGQKEAPMSPSSSVSAMAKVVRTLHRVPV